jgi:proteasome lid subunit RPN8/RPN11
MDPGSEIEIREVITKNNMQISGWYHSHPTFQPEPSLIDIENQYNYQVSPECRQAYRLHHESDGITVGAGTGRLPSRSLVRS